MERTYEFRQAPIFITLMATGGHSGTQKTTPLWSRLGIEGMKKLNWFGRCFITFGGPQAYVALPGPAFLVRAIFLPVPSNHLQSRRDFFHRPSKFARSACGLEHFLIEE